MDVSKIIIKFTIKMTLKNRQSFVSLFSYYYYFLFLYARIEPEFIILFFLNYATYHDGLNLNKACGCCCWLWSAKK